MRILHILGVWPPEYGGGVSEHVIEIAQAQAEAGHDVFALVGTGGGAPVYEVASAVDGGVTVLRFGVPAYFETEPEGWWLPHRDAVLHESRVARLVSDVLNQSAAEVIDYHVNRVLGEEALLQAGRQGVPIVASLHDFWLICGRVYRLRAPFSEACTGASIVKCALCLRSNPGSEPRAENIRAAARIIFKSPAPWRKLRRRKKAVRLVRAAMARSRYLAEMHAPLIEGPCQPILAGIRHDGLAKTSVREPGVTRFGFFAGDQADKGLEDVLAASRQLRAEGLGFEVHVFGKLSQPPGPACIARGAFGRRDRDRAYQSVDVAIMATRHVEPRGRVSEEAALLGRPSIVSNIGGLPETIRDEESGLIFAFRDPRDLHRQMRRILTEPGLLERLRAGVTPPPNLLHALPAIERTYRWALQQPPLS